MHTTEFLNKYDLRGPNFEGTPERVERMWNEFFDEPMPRLTTFPLSGKPGMIVFRNHRAWGFCPHHLLPVQYTFRMGYIPNEEVLGASKPLRVADYVLRTLPLQEDIGQMIAEIIDRYIDTKGIGVVIYGEHLCMRMRGVKSPCSDMITSYMTGVFLEEQATREEFLSL